ncbi:MAG TPA: hypothetical protein VFV10_15900 [Gammaproteobacteria bacterium]|nr:hypothetical protein [Gammaproteobacteria bacterium]
MPGELIPLAVHRPARPVRDIIRVEAVVGGLVCLTVVDGNGDAVEVYLERRDAVGLRDDVDAAIGVAQALERIDGDRG